MITKAHIRYKNQVSQVVPGVTTILGKVNFNGKYDRLVAWANSKGLEGIDSGKYRDEAGSIGSLAHEMILADLKGVTIDTSPYSKEQIDKAENCYLKWLERRKGKDLCDYCVELPLVSEEHQYGGTVDYLGWIDGCYVIADYKTGFVGIEAYIQCCAYRQLAIENGYPTPEKILILGIPRTNDEIFQERQYADFDLGWRAFLAAKEAYDVDKLLRQGGI